MQARGSAWVIVALRPPASKAASDEFTALQDDVLRALPAGSFDVFERWQWVPALAGVMRPEAIPALESNPLVDRVDLDVPGKGSLLVSVPLIRADVAHAEGFDGSGVTMAIVDTGVDSKHPDLRDAIVDEACFCRKDDGTGCCPNGAAQQFGRGAAEDDHGHGSNVAGIAASRGIVSGVGVAPGVRLVVVKVLDSQNRFSRVDQVISALNWIIGNHPEVRVVNMSLGTDEMFPDYCDSRWSYTMAMASAIDTLRSRGTSTFVSAGNDASSTEMEAPACIHAAFSVGAVWKANSGTWTFSHCTDPMTRADQITCFSNSNSTLDLLAPGAPIESDSLLGTKITFCGTSQASPHCAGAAALLLQVNPTLSVDAIEQILKSSGKPVTDPRNGVTTPRIDVAAAVAATPRIERHRAARH